MNILDELKERGYFEQATFEDELREIFDEERVKFYIGFDATADSLTIGHFIQIMVMMRMQKAGHIPVALLGAGTTMVGDPSGRTDMRQMMTEETINHNAACFEKQMRRFLDFEDGNGMILNNADWLLDLELLPFLREIGPHFTINNMISMDAYESRLQEGLTYLEFSYLLLQSYDYLHLYREHGVKLQVGGSDQWSNILGGYDLVRRIEKDKVYAMTFSLLTTADGEKMGKSMDGAIWLDEEKTSPYQLFQYMRNVDDRDVEKFLLMLTFLPTEECKKLGSLEGVEINKAKEKLAYEVTKIIHGEEAADKALEAAQALFTAGKSSDNMPSTEMAKADFEEGVGLLNLLTSLGLSQSNGEARRLIQQGGVRLNDEQITDPSTTVTMGFFPEGELIIRRGRRTYHRVTLA